MNVIITRTTPIYTNPGTSGVFVQWHVENPPATGAITFRVQKSGGPNGPFEDLVAGYTGFHYYDAHKAYVHAEEQQNLLSLQRDVYYTVTATAAGEAPSRATKYIGDTLEKRQALLRRKMHRDIRLGFKFNSIPFVLFKKKQWGVRCAACYDLTTNSVLASKCMVCFGAGFVGGYEAPFHMLARKGVTNPQISIAPQGNVEINQMELTALDYPTIAKDDILSELRQNRRYVVKHVTRTELRGVPVHQKLVMAELPRDSIEYRLVVEAGMTPTYY